MLRAKHFHRPEQYTDHPPRDVPLSPAKRKKDYQAHHVSISKTKSPSYSGTNAAVLPVIVREKIAILP